MIWSLIIGFFVGLIAKVIMPGKDPGGWIITILLGIGGSFTSHFIGSTLGWYAENDVPGFFASVFGAVLLLGLYRFFLSSKATT